MWEKRGRGPKKSETLEVRGQRETELGSTGMGSWLHLLLLPEVSDAGQEKLGGLSKGEDQEKVWKMREGFLHFGTESRK